jgi:hypothetical protein
LGWIPSIVVFKSRLIQLSKSPDGKPDHGLSVHNDASIQNINVTVLTTARHKKALKTGNAWFFRGRLLDFPTVITVTCVAFQAKGNMWLSK